MCSGIHFSPHLEPASIEEELEKCENGYVHVQVVSLVSLLRVQKLSANQAETKKGVHRYSNNL